MERSLLTGMPLDRVSAAIASVDFSLPRRPCARRGGVAPRSEPSTRTARIAGGYVMESRAGPLPQRARLRFQEPVPEHHSHLQPRSADLVPPRPIGAGIALVAPNGARFRRDVRGILPELVATLADGARGGQARAATASRRNAIKILMNSMYGVLGAGASRLFSPAVANAITHFGQLLIRLAAEVRRSAGYRVIYGDTDSLFVDAGGSRRRARAGAAPSVCAVAIGAAVAAPVRERLAARAFSSSSSRSSTGASSCPRCAAARSAARSATPACSWRRTAASTSSSSASSRCGAIGAEVSKRFQRGLLELVFHDRPVESFVREFVADAARRALRRRRSSTGRRCART